MWQCHSILQSVAVCCGVLRCDVLYCSVLQRISSCPEPGSQLGFACARVCVHVYSIVICPSRLAGLLSPTPPLT